MSVSVRFQAVNMFVNAVNDFVNEKVWSLTLPCWDFVVPLPSNPTLVVGRSSEAAKPAKGITEKIEYNEEKKILRALDGRSGAGLVRLCRVSHV